ncbi:5'-methylthioadenosine/S-adenosylhomocysteine nucleosidase [Meiothermus granaticius NBRC 107808]|uniref:adenosylhomocysteine nucleosidase n=1 Tax=Meiothermus granaticius NBRC 107808 TaxID=1227551 RepID=A0A399FEE6_9DEIN|nr:Aminodeoxyfutalosine nucleosidase [Meiothermus granaticius NBRC 107808]GEM86375.1 5'-methylthioadenosine/S-adenosylhomocysteine nucleosidase [Meiothermus granaticius NBRC 107808]
MSLGYTVRVSQVEPRAIAVFAAEGSEAQALREGLGLHEAVVGPMPIHRGRFAEREIVLLEAGVGKAAAAASVTYAHTRFAPEQAVWVGVAGALNPAFQPLDLIIAFDAVQYDVDITAFGRQPGELATGERFLPTDPELSHRLYQAAVRLGFPVYWGRLASADRFLADPGLAHQVRQTFAADAVEMEGAAALWAARSLGLRLALVRAISDGAGEEANESFEVLLESASARLAALLVGMLGG